MQALIRSAEQSGYQPKILHAVEAVNTKQKLRLPQLVQQHFGQDLTGRTFALWGLSFKPKTNDVREASSRVLMEQLWQAGATVQAFDPEAMEEIQRIYGVKDNLTLVGTKEAALKNADALLICTEWQQFKAPDFDVIKQQLKQPIIFDGRNLYEPERMQRKGIVYYAVGRGESVRKPDENH